MYEEAAAPALDGEIEVTPRTPEARAPVVPLIKNFPNGGAADGEYEAAEYESRGASTPRDAVAAGGLDGEDI